MGALTELAAQISSHAQKIEETLAAHNLPQPSFAVDGPPTMPAGPEFRELQKTRLALMDAARDMEHLTTGPEAWIKSSVLSLATDWLALAVLAHWDVFSAVPLDGEISYAHLAAKVGLAEERLRRFIRQAMTNHIFTESRPGFVAHTATSAVPARIPSFRWYIEHNTEDGGPAYPHVIPALEKWGASDQPAKSGFGIAFGLDAKDSKDSVFQFVAEDGEGEKKGFRMRRIGNAMEGMKGDGAYNVGHAQNGFDWASLGDDAIVVDLGGSVGHLSIEIASQNPNLKCIVQDFPGIEPQFHNIVPAELVPRVSFQAHDIFTPQPVRGADVYAFRLVFHDWSDPYCVQMIRNVAPAMKPGSRILVIDAVLAEWGVESRAQDRLITSCDLHMMAMMNAKERTEADWRRLFAEADAGLRVVGVKRPEGSALGFVEVVME
ncbi:MAG: hypothetical protein LQ348_003536 [Seirophora lacunosa]|nr:MAG: hypothetical protein LQ348_003536 [Seirophora lacunosa]